MNDTGNPAAPPAHVAVEDDVGAKPGWHIPAAVTVEALILVALHDPLPDDEELIGKQFPLPSGNMPRAVQFVMASIFWAREADDDVDAAREA